MKKPEFLLISDNTSFGIVGVRYIGPYRIALELEQNQIKTFVLDRYYRHPEFFNFLDGLISENTLGIGISTTFMTPPEERDKLDRYANRDLQTRSYYEAPIISRDLEIVKDWFRRLKLNLIKKSPKAKIFIGGSKAQYFSRPPFNQIEEIDYIVMGSVDGVFPKILADLKSQGEIQHKIIGGKKVVDTAKVYIQPKSCPPHEWLPHWNIIKNEALPIEISRGCVFNCKFCNYDKNESSRKNLIQLKDEFIKNYELFGTQHYHFLDDCFNDSRKKVDEVCNMILSLSFKIEWISYARFDVAVKFPETADLMVQAGAKGLFWGVESLTKEVALRAGKGTPPEKVMKFAKEFYQKYGNSCYSTGSFICGLPGETEASWNQQMEWLLKNKAFHFVQMGPLAIRPYKPEFDGSVIDFADYSRNPTKYGFTEVNFLTDYWKHETMDSQKAKELALKSMREWQNSNSTKYSITNDVWIYPSLRSLGLSHQEVYDCYFTENETKHDFLKNRIVNLGTERLKTYFSFQKNLISKADLSTINESLV